LPGVIDLRKSNRGKITGIRRKNNRGPKPKNRQPKAPMLNMRRVNDFRYDVRQIVAKSQMDESVGPSFIAQVIAKASRVGIKDAKVYVREFEERGECSKIVSDNICNLLDRYTKYR
jgi:hypothetical protein